MDKDYFGSLPVDPITDRETTWHLVPPDEQFPGSVYDVKSGAQGADRNGQPYEAR